MSEGEGKGWGWARGIGLLTGLSIATVAVLAWRIPAGNGTLGTDLIVAAVPTGEIEVSSPGPFISATAMHPAPEADAPAGSVKVRNITGQSLAIRVKVSANIPDLNSLLWMEIEASGRPLFRGPVEELARGTTNTFVLASGQRTTLDVRTWFPPSVTSGYEGRIANMDLTFVPVTQPTPGRGR